MGKQPLEENGVHRAKLWEIGFYALNNTSTNTYMMLVASISYFLIGIVGVGVVLAGSIVTIMRVWDGVTDPFVGYVVDRTNGKFGKNRPFIVAGQVIMFLSTFIMFRMLPSIPQGIRFVAFIIIMQFILLVIPVNVWLLSLRRAVSPMTLNRDQCFLCLTLFTILH